MLLRFGGNAIFLSRSSSGNDFVYLSSFTTLLSLLLRLRVMLKKERHSSAQHSPPSRTREIDTKQRPSGCCSCDEILMILRRVFVWVFGSLGFLIETLNFQFLFVEQKKNENVFGKKEKKKKRTK